MITNRKGAFATKGTFLLALDKGDRLCYNKGSIQKEVTDMSMTKRTVALLLTVLTVALLLCACGGTSVKRGETTDDTYKNESLDMTFTKPDDWIFYTDKQLADLMNMSYDLFEDEDLIESAKVTTVFEFMAISRDTKSNNNVNMTLENLKPSKSTKISVEEYAEISRNTLREQMPNANYTFGENDTVDLGG